MRLLLIIALFVSVQSFSQGNQTKDTSNVEKVIPPADSVAFISKKDLIHFLEWMGDNVPKNLYDKATPADVLNILYNRCVTIWWEEKKKKKH